MKGVSLPADGPNARPALLPRGPLKPGPVGGTQSGQIGVDPNGTLPKHHREEDARGEVRSGWA